MSHSQQIFYKVNEKQTNISLYCGKTGVCECTPVVCTPPTTGETRGREGVANALDIPAGFQEEGPEGEELCRRHGNTHLHKV